MANQLHIMHPPDEARSYAAIADADGIKLAVASNVAPQTYSAATLDGAYANPGPAVIWLPMTVSVTTAASPATYNTADAIVFTGTNELGVATTVSLTLTNAGGGETITSTLPMASVTSIAVPAQLGGGGTFSFGVVDVYPRTAAAMVQFVAGNNGNIRFEFESGRAATIPVLAGVPLVQLAAKVVSAATTALPLTIQYDR